MNEKIIQPLNNLYNVISTSIKDYTKIENIESVYDSLLDAIKSLREFRNQQKKIMLSWSNLYHDRKYINKIVDLKDFYTNMLLLLNSFSEQLILIQSDPNNVGPMCPTLNQLETMLSVEYSPFKSPLIFYDKFTNSNDEEIIVIGDINMIKVWENISNKKIIDAEFLRYLNRLKGLLKIYIKNEQKSSITQRLENSIYTPRNGYSNEELKNLIDQYERL